MKKQEMIDRMYEIEGAMRPALTRSRVNPTVGVVPKVATSAPAPVVREAYRWLVRIFDTEYKAYAQIRMLLPEEIWDRYDCWGDFDDHREVILLKKAGVALRAAIVSQKRPDFFKKGKLDDIIKKSRGKGTAKKSSVKRPSTKVS